MAVPSAADSRSLDEETPLLQGIHSGPSAPGRAAVGGAAGGLLAANATSYGAVLMRAAVALLLGSLFIVVSSGMILFNKTLMRADRFPHAPFLTSLHMLGSLTLSLILYAVQPGLFPSSAAVFGSCLAADCKEDKYQGVMCARRCRLTGMLPFAPIAVCFTVALVAGNEAYRYSQVAFLQMIKESHLTIVYLFSVIFGLEVASTRSFVILIFVAVSASVAVASDATPSLIGFMLQMLAGTMGSLQIVLCNKMLADTGGAKVDPLTMVLCLAPMTLIALIPANFMFWDAQIPEHFMQWWPLLLANVLLAFTLQVTTAICIRTLHGVGHSLVGVIKDLAIVLAAQCILHEKITALQALGFIGSICGVALYSSTKLFPDFFDPPANRT